MGDKKKTLTATIETHVAVSMRSYFSNNFISSAAFFARQALALEQIGTEGAKRPGSGICTGEHYFFGYFSGGVG
jgi:GMP synthase-like glutamine amidotransferase